MEWNDIRSGWIVRRRNKTGARLEIPILPPVASLLEEQSEAVTSDGRYVLPEHAEMYRSNRTGVSYRIRSFLERVGITTTRESSGARAISVKDFHSLRHTFAYMAGINQIPLSVVQSVLGHLSPEMTKHYQAHADRAAKEKYLAQMPNFLGISKSSRLNAPEAGQREELAVLLKQLPEDAIDKILVYAKSLI